MDLLLHYCKQQDKELLRDLYYYFDSKVELANLAVLEGYQNHVCTKFTCLIVFYIV